MAGPQPKAQRVPNMSPGRELQLVLRLGTPADRNPRPENGGGGGGGGDSASSKPSWEQESFLERGQGGA